MTDRWRLILSSFLMLFVELALIRWTGSNVIYLSYFSNFVLLGSFLGIGIGFLIATSPRDFSSWAPLALAYLLGFVLCFPITIDRAASQIIYFGGTLVPSGLPIWVILPAVFVAVTLVMACIAQGVGRVFGRFEPLEAYRLDILGSLLGIAGFSALSFTGAPPVAWGAIVGLTLLALAYPSIRATQIAGVLAAIALLGAESLGPGLSWSPYYKIAVIPVVPGVENLFVNGIPHQVIEPMAYRKQTEPIYFLPYRRIHANPLHNVLVVGAGNGGDVAIALAAGARHVDAVEIDPRIYQIGRRINPNRPYQDPRVSVHIDDGRAFLQRTRERYDLILFALPDSLTLVSGQSSLRLESYLFTLQAMRAARAHLSPGGAFAMYNYYRQDWLIDRLAGTLDRAFGHPPCVDYVGQAGLALLVDGLSVGDVRCATVWNPGTRSIPAPITDDYPFLYLRSPSIPRLYWITLAVVLLLSLALIRNVAGPLSQMKSYADLFLMGAAFMLLETKNVVQFALLFGTTWLVNALVFFGILCSVYAAIELSRRTRIRNAGVLYAVLLAALALSWFVSPDRLLVLNLPERFAAAASLAFAPVFLANLVFAQRFRNVTSSTIAFGANLLGAMIGGMLEYATLLVGYRSLLILIALLYGLAFVFGRKHLSYGLLATPDRPA